jgi:hypothetical protein
MELPGADNLEKLSCKQRQTDVDKDSGSGRGWRVEGKKKRGKAGLETDGRHRISMVVHLDEWMNETVTAMIERGFGALLPNNPTAHSTAVPFVKLPYGQEDEVDLSRFTTGPNHEKKNP